MQFADLSPAWQRLLRLFQTINFGRVEELEIRNGEPVFIPGPRVFLELKLDAADGPRPERRLDRFELRSQVDRFIEQIHRLSDGTVERIDVRHGLPFRMVIEAAPAEVDA
ncbi:MAG TPA: hypothetical protein PLK67_15285 [Bryobacteraceae bacterium]|nr:hypothetical protein [Bryobacteraceae bacterium]